MLTHALHDTLHRIENAARAAGRPVPRLLAVSKTQAAEAVAELAAQGQHAFGENYVQEALGKQAALEQAAPEQPALAGQNAPPPDLEWHLIGHLQSNKAQQAAQHFDWVQSVDRDRLVTALNRYRPPERAPLDVLIQVNIDDEASKHGCRPEAAEALAGLIAAQPRLRLRGLMLIPTPHADIEMRRPAFRAARELFERLASGHAGMDTLSMGMSDDLEIAIAEGATMVRVGTALFGARPRKP